MKLGLLVGAAPTLRLQTPRLVLRRLGPDDAAQALAHEQDRRIMRWIRDPQPIERMRERFAALLAPWDGDDGEWLGLAVSPPADPSLLGLVFCRVTVAAHETMEIGYRFAVQAQGQGHGYEATARLVDFLCREIGVRKLVAHCVLDNTPSLRLLAKLGMQREAHFREHVWLDGRWRDECVHGLLGRDWAPRPWSPRSAPTAR